MFEKLINFSLENKLLVLIGVLALVGIGVYSAAKIPLDAVPDITNNQVQIVSTAPTLAPQEVEQLITYPLESAMTNIPGVVEVRSISRYGLSVITIVFEEDIPTMLTRQYVQEQLNVAKAELPSGLTEPELMPITTGLGEIYQYVLTVDPEFVHQYDATKLRSIQEWIVKRQLNGTAGIIEVSSFGGNLKQYEVAIQPDLLKVHGLSIPEIIEALETNNQNSGGSYIEKGPYSFYIRTEGRAKTISDIESILIRNEGNIPITIGDVAEVRIGSAKRYGAMTMDGQGEVVGGITLMLKGANSSEVLQNVKTRMDVVEASLPEGVHIYPYLDRSKLIGKTIDTVKKNLIEGGLIVIFVLLLLLGNFRAGLIVASVIPLSMLFALNLMRYFGISANLMSLGAIDFGIVIDGAVIIVESLLHTLTIGYLGQKLTQSGMDQVVRESTSKIYRSAAFGVLIILVVFIPILTLEGTEGKTFQPMAQTVGFAILGSMLLSLTYVPVMASLFLKKKISDKKNLADRLMDFLKGLYKPTLTLSLKVPMLTIGSTLVVFVFSILVFNRLGAEFVPTLEEGDIAMQQSIKPGSSLQESIHTSSLAEQILLDNFPEVEHVVSKIGTAEVPTDPMAIEDADVMIILKDKEAWTSADTREELMAKMKEALAPITWASFEFTQPIQLRFNELMTGSKSDISVKIFGEDVALLKSKADEAAEIIQGINGAGDVKVDQTDGLQQLSVKFKRQRLAQYGIHVADLNQTIRAAYAGEIVGDIFEEERRFDLVVRMAPKYRQELDLAQLTISTNTGRQIPLSEIAEIEEQEGPMLISREQARRFINIGVNVRNRDVASLVSEIHTALGENLTLPAGYEIQYGGQFENLENAKNRLMLAVPVALALILLLLFMAFGSMIDTLVIFMAVPLSAVGGILALWIRDMPFSISSGIGFIALFGVSVLNGIVLVSAFKQLKVEDFEDLRDLINKACLSRLRPVLMTALVAALGFLPMAISVGSGAEVQRPLATVVIGGLITSTLLTLVLLPTLYYLIFNSSFMKKSLTILVLLIGGSGVAQAQSLQTFEEVYEYAIAHHPLIENGNLAKQSIELNQQALIPWEPLSVEYQGGQINYSGFDHQWNLRQDISPLLRFRERNVKKELIATQVNLLESEQQNLKHALKFDLRAAFNDWQYWSEKKALYDTIFQMYEELDPKIQLQFQVGEIDLFAFEWFKQEKINISQTLSQVQLKADDSEREIRKMAMLNPDVQLVSGGFEKITENEFEQSGIYLNQQRYAYKEEVLTQQIQLNNISRNQVNWNLGYFAQSLESEYLFQGAILGIGIPLDQRQGKVKTQQLEIEKLQVQNEMQLQLHQYQLERSTLNAQLVLLQQYLDTYQSTVENGLLQMMEKASFQYELGEIDFLRFSQIQERLLARQMDYLDWMKSYNEVVLKIAYLNQLYSFN
ncbi:MAG: CusA/CzcA family heavy metal efflux RND transporter [Saprospiraceae bacterium]|nr:CusA/CzcA family heavy metal efflux RND transporter [Saprospiraceae bacterium]